MQKERTYRDEFINGWGLYPGGIISGWDHIRNIFVGKWMVLYPAGLGPEGGRALMWDFTA